MSNIVRKFGFLSTITPIKASGLRIKLGNLLTYIFSLFLLEIN